MGADAANKNRDGERHHNQSVIFLITCPLWNTVILQQLRDTTIPAVFV